MTFVCERSEIFDEKDHLEGTLKEGFPNFAPSFPITQSSQFQEKVA